MCEGINGCFDPSGPTPRFAEQLENITSVEREVDNVARDAALFSHVLTADNPALADAVADRYAKVIANVVGERRLLA